MRMEPTLLVSMYHYAKEQFNELNYTLNHDDIIYGSHLHQELTLERREWNEYLDDIIDVCNWREIELNYFI